MTRFKTHLYLTAIALLTLLFLLIAAANLPNFFPVSADDAWIMSASYKLANQGIFGSDLYTGFFNAESHYFIALPVYHLLQTAVFKLIGFGVAQARLPNLISAILLIWITASLAQRHHGRKTALLTALLLIFWRSDLTATEPRVPLLAYAHSGRYDITATLLVWTAIWLLDDFARRPRLRTALLMGLIAALATLTQFFGIFVLLPIALRFWCKWGIGFFKQRSVQLFTAAFLLTILPYAAYSLAHLDDFIGQSILKGERTNFFEPAFYLNNILSEPNRYSTLLQRQQSTLTGGGEPFRPFGPWLLSVLVITAVCYSTYRLWQRRGQNWPGQWAVPWLSLASFGLCLTLFDQTKVPVYTVLLLPGVCLAFAVLSQKLGQWLWHLKRPLPLRLAFILPLATLLALLILEGANSHRQIYLLANDTTPYQSMGQQLEAALEPSAVLLGSERWWPALKAHPYLALNNLWSQWLAAEKDGRSPDFTEIARATSANFLIVNNNVTGDLNQYPVSLQTQFHDYLAACGTLTAVLTDKDYGHIEIYQLKASDDC